MYGQQRDYTEIWSKLNMVYIVAQKGSSQKSYRLFYAINIQMSYRFFYSTFKSHTILFSCQFNFQMSYRFFLVNLHISYKKYSLKIKPQLNKPNQTFPSSLAPNPAGGNRGLWMYAGFFYVFQSSVRLIQVW